MELEAVALGETLSYVLNSPYKIGEVVVDFLSGFGFKFDKEAKDAQKPEEHKENGEGPKDETQDSTGKKPKAKKHKADDTKSEAGDEGEGKSDAGAEEEVESVPRDNEGENNT